MNRNLIKQAFLEERKKKSLSPQSMNPRVVRQGHIPIVKQLEDMLKTHTVQPGETLWGIAQQNLRSGERWPDIRDLNVPVLEEGLSRFAPGDPRREKELGHWIFPGQEFRLPMQEEEPSGLQGAIQELLQRKYTDKQIRHGLEMPAKAPSVPQVAPEDMTEGIPMLDPRQRGVGAQVDRYEWPMTPEKAKPTIDTDKLLTDYIEWNYTRKGKTPTEEQVTVAKTILARHPEMYQKGFAQETPKNAIGKVGNFLSRMSEAGADAFTLTEGDMPKATTGNSAADGIADTVGGLMGFLNPEGPAKAFNYAGQVLWNIAPKLSTMLKVPVGLLYKSLSTGLGMSAIGGYKAESIKEAPKEILTHGTIGAFAGAAEHIAGPVMNAVTKKFGIPAGSFAERGLEEMHRQGSFMSVFGAGFSILEGKSAEEVARDAVVSYGLGALIGGLSAAYSEATFKIAGKNFTVEGKSGEDINKVVEKMMKDGWVQVRPGVFEHPNQPPGYHRTLEVEYKGEHISLARLMRQHGGEIPEGVVLPEGVSAPGVPAKAPARIAGLIGERGEVEAKPVVTPEPAPPPEVKLPQAARDLVIRTKNPLKKEYGRGIISWLEGGEKPAIPDGLSATEAKDMEAKLTRMAEKEGIAPKETAPATPPPEIKPPTAENQLQGWLDSVTVGYPAESKEAAQTGIMRYIAENNDAVRKHGLAEVPRLAAEAGYIEKAPVAEVAPKEPEKPPEPAKEPWQMTQKEYSTSLAKEPTYVDMQTGKEMQGAFITPEGKYHYLEEGEDHRDFPGLYEKNHIRKTTRGGTLTYEVNSLTEKTADAIVGDLTTIPNVRDRAFDLQVTSRGKLYHIEVSALEDAGFNMEKAIKDPTTKALDSKGSEFDKEAISVTARDKHRNILRQAQSEGKEIPADVLADYPELTPEPGEAKTEKPPAEETVRVYKGWVPYDFRDPAKPMIERVERQSEFPSFTKKDAGIKVAGFFTTDISVAKHFAKGISKDGVVGTFDLTIGRALEIDAKGEKAGNVQFEDQGKQFRDAARSGEYDTIIIRNTSDEGDVYVALSPDNIGIVSHDSILDAEGNLIADEPPAKTEKPPAEKKEAPPTKALSDYGLQIVKTKTAKGNPVWEVSGNTHQHKDAIRRAGGKWYGAKKVWSFYEDNDPTSKLLDTLAGKEVKDSDVDTGRAEAAETKGSGKITGLDRRVSVQQAEREHYKQYLITRGGVPKDVKGGPGNDPAISKILRPHQVDGVNMAVAAIDQYGGFILADGTGAGKTMQIVATMNHYMKQGNVALVVVPNRTIINDAYKRDAGMLGIDYNVVKGGALEKGKLNITTYASLSKVKKVPDYVAFDEAHSLKNVDAARSKLGRRMAGNAKGVLFASATPFDKGEHLPYLEKTGIFSKRSHEQIMVGLGYKKDTLTVSTSYGERQITTWKPDAPLAERVRRMDALFDEVAGLGLMVKREVSMDRVAVGYWNIELPAEAHAKLNEVEDHYLEKYEAGDASQLPPLAKAQMLMAQRRFQEHYKKKDVCALAKSEIEAGRQVVIFATRTSPSHLKEPIYAMFGGERVLVDEFIVDTSPPTLPDIAEMFEKEGIKCSKIYGGGNVDKEVAKFQKGETKVALATPEKGGAGLSLDDTVGGSPRTMIVMTPLFSGVDNVQLPGRINRMSTKSSSRVVYVLADTAIDEWNKAIITEKMKTLNAVVRGDISKLDLDDMDRDAGTEALPEPEKETFKQERLKDRQMEVVSRRGHSRPYGPQWEVQVTTFRDVETGKEYLWWSDRALSDFVPELKAGDKVTLTATTRQGYGGNDINLTHVKVDRTGPVPNKPADHHIRPMSKREGARIENHYDVGMTRVLFDNAPGEEVERQFKGRGFEWNASAKAWEKKIGKSSAKHAEEVLDKYFKPEKPAATRGEPLGDIAGYTETVIMDTKTSEDITIRREYRIVELTAKGEKPYSVQQRVIKGGDAGEWRAVAAFDESMDANEYVAGIDDIVAIDPDVADQIKTEEPKEKAEPLKPFEPIEKGNKDSAFTEVDNIEVHFEYCLSEADDIVTSFAGIDSVKPNPSYYQDDQRLQPRNINRKATQNRINEFVAKLEPRRMGENTEISKGAPTVGADGRVEIGNHRTWALITAYKKDLPLATKYRKWLTDNATKFGISKGAVERAKEPILVRLRTTDIDRAELARKGNVPGEQKMSAAETAELDAQKIDDRLMAAFVPHEEGRLETADNKNFINRFIHDVVPSSERNDMIAADGSGLTVDGEKRIRNAILAKVYGNTNALIKLMEETNPNVRNIMNAMNVLAPKLLLQKHEMEKGNLYPLDLSENLSRAMVKMSELRDSKMTVEGYFSARQLFGIELTNLEKDILAILDENKFSALRIGSIFKEYIRGVEVLGHPKQISIISQTPPTRAELLQASVEKAKEGWELTKSEKQEKAGQSSLFKDKEMDGERNIKTNAEGGGGVSKGGTQKAVGPAPKLKTAPPLQSIPPTRRRDIVKFLSDKLDIPIRVGRYRQQARGIFKTWQEVIRTKLAQDIPTIAHEVGHYLDKKFNLSATKSFDGELMSLGQVTSKPSYSKSQVRAEGVAEFMRLYLTDPQDAIRQAPHYYAAFEQIMAANQDIHDVLLQARQDITNWISQPAKARVLGVLSVGEKSGRKMTLDRLYAAAVDELHPIKKYVDALFPEGVDFDEDPFMQAWLSRGWAGKAETLLNHGIVDKDYKKIGPSLKEILDPVKSNLDDFRAYITAKRAIELHNRDIESGITLEDAEQVVRELETPEFIKAQKKLVGFSDALVDVLVDAQILDKAGADTFRAMNRNYVPFYRVFEEMGGSHGYGKTGYANLGSPVKRMKGSQRDIVDPLESIVRNAFFFTNVAERNNVGRLVVELAEFKEGAGKWVEKVPTSMRPVTFGLSEIKGALEGIGIDTDGLDLDNAATIFRPSPFPAGKENILAVWREGKREFYQVEPELYRALLSLDKESANLFVNLLSKPAALLRAGATLSPDFMVRNPIRDMWTALVYSRYGYKPADFIKGLFSVLKKDDLYWKFHASGAAHGAMVSLDRDYLQGSLRGMLQTSAKEKAKFLLTHPVEVLRALSEYGEMATRLGEFGRGVKAEGKKGKGIRQAALSARDVTLDFARWGNVGKIPNRVIAFFNANIQGMDKMARAFRQKPGQSILRCLLYITLPSIILYMMNRDDERYQELPQWEKDLFWIVLTPKHVFRIPKPFELGVIFGTLPERVLDYIYTEDPEAFKGYLNTVKEAGLPDILPTAFTGWLEAFYANKSFFTDRPIVPVGEERLPAELQYGNYTSETAKLIGKYLHISPRKADHIAYSYGGGLARYGTKVLDQLLKAVGATEKVTKPASTLADYPVMGAFTSRVWSNSKSMDTLYTRLDEAEKAYSKRKAGRELTAKEQDQLSNLKRYRSAASDMSELRLAGQRVFDDPRMTAEEKREKMDTINILRINIARRAIGLDPITVKP